MIDNSSDRLPESVDSCGENGEFHTFVTEHPAFDSPVSVEVTGTVGTGRMRYATLREERS